MNKAILMGRLTRDPEVRYSQNNLTITSFTLAVDRRFVRQGEERQADFIPIVTFGKTAEFCEKYYRKGQQVLVVGRIQPRTWDDNEGRRRYITEVICDEAYFADTKRQDGGMGARPDDFGYYPPPPPPPDGMDSPFGMGAQAFGGGQQRSSFGEGGFGARQAGGPSQQGAGDYGASPWSGAGTASGFGSGSGSGSGSGAGFGSGSGSGSGFGSGSGSGAGFGSGSGSGSGSTAADLASSSAAGQSSDFGAGFGAGAAPGPASDPGSGAGARVRPPVEDDGFTPIENENDLPF